MADPVPRAFKPTKNKDLVDYIILNEAKHDTTGYETMPEIAAKFHVTPELCYRYRQYLRHKGMLPPPKSTPGKRQFLNTANMAPEAVQVLVEAEVIPGEVERLKHMARLLRIGSPQIKISAFKALEEASRGRGERVGPPAPLTDDERTARMMRLMLAIGQDTTDRAYDAAFPSEVPQPEPEAPLPTEPPPVREPDGPSPLPLPDMPPADAPGSGS